jgi:hypothetical protein
MKKAISLVIALVMLFALVACGTPAAETTPTPATEETPAPQPSTEVIEGTGGSEKGTINLYSFTDEIPLMAQEFVDANPDFGWAINATVIATTDGLYEPALDQALAAGGDDAPDMYGLEAAFVLKYTQGDMAEYAAPYTDLGFDLDGQLASSEIAPYSVEIGTRPTDGAVVALGYQATGGAFIYRSSIAKDVWGTDDPDVIKEKIGPGIDKFFAGAEELKAKGYAIISGDGDLWHAIENSSDTGWIVDGKLNIDPKREEFLDLSKKLKDNGYHNDTQDWQEPWYADMAGLGPKEVFGFFGPAWLINYTLGDYAGDAAGDYRVCESPIGFFWGGTWIAANKDSSPEKKEAVGQIIEWITLQDDDDSLQYAWANGTYKDSGTKDTVASNTVMARSDGTLEFLGGQDMFKVFVPANELANGSNLTQYDQTINDTFREWVRQYTAGAVSREDALAGFKQEIFDILGLESA